MLRVDTLNTIGHKTVSFPVRYGAICSTPDTHWLATRLHWQLIIKLQQGDGDRGNHQEQAEDQKVPLNVQPPRRQHSSDHRASDRTNPS
jgi:hypothetical protein